VINMIGKRSILSLAQFLEVQNPEVLCLILDKHSLSTTDVVEAVEYHSGLLNALVTALESGGESEITSLLSEVVRTRLDMRYRVSPRYRYDERFGDLERCLQLDGYVIKNADVIPIDPSIIGTLPVEDDLTDALRTCGLPKGSEIIRKLADSVDAFRAATPNYNASLNDARIALQTIATDIATVRVTSHAGTFDATKWGSVISYLRVSGFITVEEEKGLVGVFGFVSPGSHRPLGFSELEFARLGRSLVSGMCWFLVKRYEASA
jgi:hypothetical protein